MSYGTITNTSTFTVVDIRKTFESFDADLRMIAHRTATWASEYTSNVVHDIVKLAENHYLDHIEVQQLDANGRALQVSIFRVNAQGSAITGPRAGGNDWVQVSGARLTVVLNYTPAWHALTAEKKAAFCTSNGFKIGWVAATNTSYDHLTRSAERTYALKGYELTREDYK
jgi:hypothetical protein